MNTTTTHRELRPSWPASRQQPICRRPVSCAPRPSNVLARVLTGQGLALLAAVALAALVATPPAQARTSLSGLQQEVNDLRATVCGPEVSQADCDLLMAGAVSDRLSDLEAQAEQVTEALCHLVPEQDIDQRDALGCDNFGALRLVGGLNEDEGRLEVFGNGEWGTVCDDRFDDVDAGVACRQLGYADGTAVQFLSSQPGFGRGSGAIHLDDLECLGSEGRLVECPARDFGVHNCSHFEDVGVRCTD